MNTAAAIVKDASLTEAGVSFDFTIDRIVYASNSRVASRKINAGLPNNGVIRAANAAMSNCMVFSPQ